MFSSKGKDALPAPLPATPQPASKRAARGHSAPSIISADLVVNGTLISAGDIQIDGRVEGDVRSAGLVIGDKAEIHGEIYAEDVTVRGKVVGRIRASKILLASTSHVEGDILHEAFAVESGAFFEGNCRHSDNPLGEPSHQPPIHQTSGHQASGHQAPVPQARAAAASSSVMPGAATLAPLGQAG